MSRKQKADGTTRCLVQTENIKRQSLFYEENPLRETSRVLLEAGGEVQGLSIPLGQWHTVNVLEPTVILECKDGRYEPLAAEDMIEE